MEISVEDLRERFDLSQEQMNAQFRKDHLAKASRIIGDLKLLGSYLEVDMTAAIGSQRDLQSKKLAVLRKWKEKYAWKATYRIFIEALLQCGRADCASDVCTELLTQSKYK